MPLTPKQQNDIFSFDLQYSLKLIAKSGTTLLLSMTKDFDGLDDEQKEFFRALKMDYRLMPNFFRSGDTWQPILRTDPAQL